MQIPRRNRPARADPATTASSVGLFLAATAWAAADPIFSIDITTAENGDFGSAVADIRSVGAEATSLSLFWDELEPRPGVYDPQNDWPAIANTYDPGLGLSLTLTFSIIDTVADRRPDDLKGRPWDDPEVIARLSAHIGAVLARMPDTALTGIAIGNEVDGLLTDQDEIAAFARLLAAARKTVQRHRPEIAVGTKLTFAGVSDPNYRPLLAASSAAFVTYYPLNGDFTVRGTNDVPDDVGLMRAMSGSLPLFIAEAGYPSDGCNASPKGQRDFVVALLEAVEATEQVALVSLTWLHDIPSAEVEAFESYYAVSNTCFARFLGSLGLKTTTGIAKLAFAALTERAG